MIRKADNFWKNLRNLIKFNESLAVCKDYQVIEKSLKGRRLKLKKIYISHKYIFYLLVSVGWIIRGYSFIIRNFLRSFFKKTVPKVLLYAPSRNNLVSLKFVYNCLKDDFKVSFIRFHNSKPIDTNLNYDFPYLNISISISISVLLEIPITVFKVALYLYHMELKNIIPVPDYFTYTVIYSIMKNILKSNDIILIGVANDHSPGPCALRDAAIDQDIKVFYIQHAHITDKFPPLKYDLALLDGEISKEIYSKIGDKTINNTVLVGNTKLAGKTRLMKRIKISDGVNLGIGIDVISKERLQSIINELAQSSLSNYMKKVVIRQHPSDNVTNFYFDEKFKFPVEYCDSRLVTEIEYAENIDVNISGNASLHLDMVCLGVPSLYLSCLDDFEEDYYGFVKEGLVLKINNISSITQAHIDYYMSTDYANANLVKRYNFSYLMSTEEICEIIRRNLLKLISS